MKKTILLLAMAGVALTACTKNENEAYKFRGDEQIYLNGVEQPKFKSSAKQFTLAEIVRNDEVNIFYDFGDGVYHRGFAPEQRDTINNRLMMWATDVLTEDGRLITEFIGSTNVYFQILTTKDTVGYIPQSVIDNARVQIESLYAQERYDEIYELFHTAFVFYPCTGEEYKDIVANGGD